MKLTRSYDPSSAQGWLECTCFADLPSSRGVGRRRSCKVSDVAMIQTICSPHHIAGPQEIERLRELNLQAEQEKVNAVSQVRNEAKEEIVKMKDKIQEVDKYVSVCVTLGFLCQPRKKPLKLLRSATLV